MKYDILEMSLRRYRVVFMNLVILSDILQTQQFHDFCLEPCVF